MSPEELDRLVSLVRRMEDDAHEAAEEGEQSARAGNDARAAFFRGRGQGILDVVFPLKSLLGLGKLG